MRFTVLYDGVMKDMNKKSKSRSGVSEKATSQDDPMTPRTPKKPSKMTETEYVTCPRCKKGKLFSDMMDTIICPICGVIYRPLKLLEVTP